MDITNEALAKEIEAFKNEMARTLRGYNGDNLGLLGRQAAIEREVGGMTRALTDLTKTVRELSAQVNENNVELARIQNRPCRYDREIGILMEAKEQADKQEEVERWRGIPNLGPTPPPAKPPEDANVVKYTDLFKNYVTPILLMVVSVVVGYIAIQLGLK